MGSEAVTRWLAVPRRTVLRLWRRLGRLPRWLKPGYHFTSITRRIAVLNVLGVVVVVLGILFLSTYKVGLIESRRDNLLSQGQIIATSIADKLTFAPERQPGAASLLDTEDAEPAGHLNPEDITQLIRALARQTGIRVRVYTRDGDMIVDSERLFSGTAAARPVPQLVSSDGADVFTRIWRKIQRWTSSINLPVYEELGGANGKAYAEIQGALKGTTMNLVRVNRKGETVLTAGVAIGRKGHEIAGALLLTSREGEIDDLIALEGGRMINMALLVAAVTLTLSVLLARTIANPMRELARAADSVRASVKSRNPIPDYSGRSDEIGHLSAALRDMTAALYRRMDAIESFAADVAHELKNPLTSMRSAAEALPLASDENRARLIAVIQHDVRRMNRLITDISDVSRLDAEMAREDTEIVDTAQLLGAICGILNDIRREETPQIVLKVETPAQPSKRFGRRQAPSNAFLINGHEDRLSQVINNIVDNAISFSPLDGQIAITCRRLRQPAEIEITIEDDGPGIPAENLEKVFTRFYTDRPGQDAFGQNSGLGLHISQQIVAAHGGRIWAENRKRKDGLEGSAGARFVIRLPAL